MITKPELWDVKGIDNLLYIATTLNNIFQQGIVIFADLTKRLRGNNFTNQCLVLNLLYILKQIWQNIQEVAGPKPKCDFGFWEILHWTQSLLQKSYKILNHENDLLSHLLVLKDLKTTLNLLKLRADDNSPHRRSPGQRDHPPCSGLLPVCRTLCSGRNRHPMQPIAIVYTLHYKALTRKRDHLMNQVNLHRISPSFHLN